jgi:hypothetical protein
VRFRSAGRKGRLAARTRIEVLERTLQTEALFLDWFFQCAIRLRVSRAHGVKKHFAAHIQPTTRF